MEDLLIVRISDRSKKRFERRRANVPLGANLGLALGAAFGLLFASGFDEAPLLGLALGIAVGLAIGGLLGRFLRPSDARRRKPRPFHYDGIPASGETPPAERSD